jgi:hypothetical protein
MNGETENIYRILFENLEEKRLLARARSRHRDIIIGMDFKKMG